MSTECSCGRPHTFPELKFAPHSRRAFLQRASLGVGSLALASLFARTASATATGLHHAPKAKRVIWLYMDGGISHVDTFDPKPRLTTDAGKKFPMKIEATQFDSNGPVMAPLWEFKPRGQSGIPVSSMLPYIAECVDDLAVIRSMTNESAVHANANYWMHTGWGTAGRPSIGSWINYGLGSEADDLPGFVALNAGLLPTGGIDNYKSGFLPATFSASVFERKDPAVSNLTPANPEKQKRQLQFIAAQDHEFSQQLGKADAIESAIKNYELAARLQTSVPSLLDLSGESEATKKLYGFDAKFEHTRNYAKQCLLARRLVERGVRFVALSTPKVKGDERWDAHGDLKGNHTDHALAIDQPIAGLLKDLKSRGLFKDTLVVFATEFGRTPFSQGSNGRDHNQLGFSIWLAGAGIKGGTIYGATDEFGYKAVENKLLVHDLHATVLHLLGVDHTKQTYHYSGRDYRLTDVHGHVVSEIMT
ncbi:MAG TPA: DUF1501 domain-containing protein [Planctomycetota bacterium]|nr:DUF1501 domain-containing protein [Planctomycetota bacterium]